MFRGTRRYYRDITERILVLRNLFLYGSTCKYYLFKCPKRHILVLISNLYLFLKVPAGNIDLYSYGGTRRYCRTYTYTSYLILYYGAYSCISDLILVFRILYLYYGSYTWITDLILVLQSLFLYFGSYTCITEHTLVLRILYLCYRAYTYITDTEVPVGTTEILLVQKYL